MRGVRPLALDHEETRMPTRKLVSPSRVPAEGARLVEGKEGALVRSCCGHANSQLWSQRHTLSEGRYVEWKPG